MSSLMTFYNKLPKKVTDPAERLLKFMKSGECQDPYEVVKFYFDKYWDEFRLFWQRSGEKVGLMYNFCGNPDNAVWLIEFVFSKYPDVLAQVVKDMDEMEVEK